eukprot:g57097.t1
MCGTQLQNVLSPVKAVRLETDRNRHQSLRTRLDQERGLRDKKRQLCGFGMKIGRDTDDMGYIVPLIRLTFLFPHVHMWSFLHMPSLMGKYEKENPGVTRPYGWTYGDEKLRKL